MRCIWNRKRSADDHGADFADVYKRQAIDRGILYISGMIAGEGLVGILLAVFAVVELDLTKLLGGLDVYKRQAPFRSSNLRCTSLQARARMYFAPKSFNRTVISSAL